MGKFRFKTILIVLVFTLAVPFYAFAKEPETDFPEPEITVVEPEAIDIEPYGAGVWDPVGTQNLKLYYSFALTTKTLSTGGGDFKVKVTSSAQPANVVYIQPVVNGTPLTMTTVPLINGTREMIIRDIPKGQVYFLCRTSINDTIYFEFFD